MKTRVKTGFIIGICYVAVMAAGYFFPYVYPAVYAIIGLLAVYELLYQTGFAKKTPLFIASAVFTVISPFFIDALISFDYLTLTVLYVIALSIIAIVCNKTVELGEVCYTGFTTLYVAFSLRCLTLICITPLTGLFLLLIALSSTAVADMGAYFGGLKFGKHKLCPVVSPKKTVEGLIFGIASSEIAVLIVCLIFKFAFNFSTINYFATLLFTPVIVVAGVMGDLFASLIKRHAGIKDYSNFMPGHGGFMDRFDSLLLAAPVIYYLNSLVSFSGM